MTRSEKEYINSVKSYLKACEANATHSKFIISSGKKEITLLTNLIEAENNCLISLEKRMLYAKSDLKEYIKSISNKK